jgi:hypothetical protein
MASVLATPCALGAKLGGDPVPRRAGHDDLGHNQSFHGAQTSLSAVQHGVFSPIDQTDILALLVNIDAGSECVGDGNRLRQGNSAAPRIQFDDCHDGPGVPQPYKRNPVGGHAATRKLHTNDLPQLCPLTTGGHAQLPPALALTGATPHLRCPARGAFSFRLRCQSPSVAQYGARDIGNNLPPARHQFQSLLAFTPDCLDGRTALHRAVQCAGKATARQFQFAPGRFSQRRSGLFGVTRVSGESPRFHFKRWTGGRTCEGTSLRPAASVSPGAR